MKDEAVKSPQSIMELEKPKKKRKERKKNRKQTDEDRTEQNMATNRHIESEGECVKMRCSRSEGGCVGRC